MSKELKACPNCPNIGQYAVADENGDPEPVQCEFCYTEPNSVFNVVNALQSELYTLKKQMEYADIESGKATSYLTSKFSALKKQVRELKDEVTLQTVKHMNAESRLAIFNIDLREAVQKIEFQWINGKVDEKDIGGNYDDIYQLSAGKCLDILRSHGLIEK